MTIRVGLLGAGLIAAYHAIQLNLSRDAASTPGSTGVDNTIVAVYDPDRERAAGLAGGQGAEVADRPEDVVAASDAVFVCTWTSEHLGMVRLAAESGVPVFCEKPLSVDLASSRELVEVVHDAGIVNMVGLVMRTSPTMLVLREMVEDPTSGRVMNVVFRDDQYIPTQGMYASTWRSDRALAGSGALLEHSIHDLDLLEWLFGAVDSVAAHQSFFHGIDGIEDSVSSLVKFRSGATGSLASVWHDVLARPSQRRMEVFCERATITLDADDVGPVRRQTSDGEEVVGGHQDLVDWLSARGIPTTSSEDDFLAAVRTSIDGGEAPRLRPDVDDALRAHVMADAIYRSAAADGAPVAIPVDLPR
ncbi:MAG: Gfo/Idh/MocA family oxidoreductase [Actinobacteria bacterium]|nr:Gfo/Idh/MocA family oxidoreductase [Actinomycetota bacterium]